MKRFLLIFTALACASVAFSYTNILDNGTNQMVTSAWNTDAIVVGSTTSGNTLNIFSGGVVNSDTGTIGIAADSTNNVAWVSGNKASWTVTHALALGVGSNNLIAVDNGGTITAGDLEISAGNNFYLGESGTFIINNDFAADTNGFDWAGAGHLVVASNLTGMAVSPQGEAFLDEGRRLTLNGGTWRTEINNLTVGLESAGYLAATNGGWTFVGEVTTSDFVADATGGIAVASSNTATLVVDNGSTVKTTGGLYIGSTNGLSGAVTVTNSSTITAEKLVIDAGSELNLDRGGKLAITGAYDADVQTAVHWNSGGELAVSGTLTKSNGLDGAERTLTLGGDWTLGSDLTLSGMSNQLNIVSGAGVINDAAYVVGSNNTVVVSGAGSSWVNTGALNITNDNNRVAVQSGGIITVDSLHITDGNFFNLNHLGTLAVTGGFDVTAQSNLNWNSGGTLSIGGALTGMATTNGTEELTSGRKLMLDDGTWETGTHNLLVTGDGTTLSLENGGWISVAGGATNHTTGGFYIDAAGHAATVTNGGAIYADMLTIAAGGQFNLDNGGTFASTTNFNVQTAGFNWNSGGHLSVGGDLTGMDTVNTNGNDYFLLDGGRDLTLDGGQSTNELGWIVGLGSSGNDLVLKNTGTLVSATSYIGYRTDAANNSVSVTGGSTWNNAGDLFIGFGGSSNYLAIASGGTVNNQNAFIGGVNSTGNYASVSGSNSQWNVLGDLTLYSSNSIDLSDGGEIAVGGNMMIHSNAFVTGAGLIQLGGAGRVLSFVGDHISLSPAVVFNGGGGSSKVAVTDGTFYVPGSNSQQYVDFQRLEMINSSVVGYGSLDAFGTVDMQGGVIDPTGPKLYAARLEIAGDFSASGTVYRAQVYDTIWDELVFTGAKVDLSNLEADIFVHLYPTNGGSATILSSTMGFSNDFSSISVADGLLLYDARLTNINDRVDIVVEANNEEFSSSLEYAGTEGVRAGFAGMRNMVFARTKQMRRNMVATDHAISQEAFLLNSTNAPAGARGPGDQNTIFDMHVWIQQFSGKGDYDAQGTSRGFDLNNNGTTIGFDKIVGDGLTAGLNYTYARSDSQTSGGSTLDTETYWIGVYGEWVGEQGLYVDALAAYGHSNYDSVRAEDAYRGLATYRGQSFGAYADVGQYYHYKNLALSPYAGLNILSLMADSHTENTSEGAETQVDEATRTWFESALGLKLRHRFDTQIGRFQTTGFAEWTHDFIHEDIYSTMSAANTPSPVDMAHISPDADMLNGGLGFSWMSTDYLEIGVGYNGRFGDSYEEHTGSVMLDIRF